ncbi:mediator of RNA polymerase II transcription subunit 8 [Asparagus officinalis]|uniref:mediator of RNA polymerase II transcription subunit 8 n=1 Tax=Asparagus officinalis TaxID=4686 RepID=UPI00098E543C|nr:mediator of RNA polymerase II transcription subunit 8 [Asparagus officinalis]
MEVAGGPSAGVEAAKIRTRSQATAQEQAKVAYALNRAVHAQLNLESVKTRAVGLFNAISRILEHIDVYSRSNSLPKWQETLGQFSMVNMELFNIVEDIKKVSKPFVVHPKNVNGENAAILPVMLSSKLLPEMEAEDNTKREQLLSGITNLPVTMQIEKLKARIDMIAAACDTAEKVIADARKQYGLGSRQGPSLVPTLDKVQAAKIQEQENMLRNAVNFGEGLRTGSQRELPSSLPSHLVDVLNFGDGPQNHGGDNSGMLQKGTPPFSAGNVNPQGAIMQNSGAQLIGRSVASPSGGPASFDNASTPPLQYANSPRSGTNMMNTPSPQQQQQRQKMMQIPQHQLLAQQQLRQSTTGVLGQSSMSQLHDLQAQTQQKFPSVPNQLPMQYSQPLAQQQFQNRQLQPSHMQLNMAQNQINQGNQLRSHLGQFAGSANSALFNAAQSSPNSQMITNMSATMQSQSLLPRMQTFGLSGGHPQRNHPSQMLNDQMFGMGASNPASMVAMQQQQGGFGNMTNAQSLQQSMVGLPNTAQNPNFSQQRQQNQQ